MSIARKSRERHEAWMEADDGLFESVDETKFQLAKAVTGLDFNAGVCNATKDAIKASLEQLDMCTGDVDIAKKTLRDFDQLASELNDKISELHLQVSKTRMFIAREIVAHHDKIAIDLTDQELLQIQELNAVCMATTHNSK